MEDIHTRVFKYFFKFDDGSNKSFEIVLNYKDLTLLNAPVKKEHPDWTRLENFKCPHCPLDPAVNEYCPLAITLPPVLESFGTVNSFEECDVVVSTPDRTITKRTSVQAGVSAMLGIFMVSSGCPVLGRLKPMLYFHLPFATLDETQIRAFSLYLLAQYLKFKKGKSPDWDMEFLHEIYDDIRILNQNVSKKIVNLEQKDTSINSLIILNNFADYVTFTIDEKMLEEIEFYVREFL
ncbi:MAG: hypothetical protein HUU43_14375 [Ignavibacteriaceae bacterium]|nr:hypothetical protein [Ignavibacteriaceae bacterium]